MCRRRNRTVFRRHCHPSVAYVTSRREQHLALASRIHASDPVKWLTRCVPGRAVHFLLHQWSVVGAWICTIGSAYGALWLIADYRATVLRPILVSGESILFRAGFRCTVQVPLDRIAGVSRNKPQLGKECVNLTFLGTPTRWLTLSEPMVTEGPYGLRRRVRAIGIAPDAADDFDRALDRSV